MKLCYAAMSNGLGVSGQMGVRPMLTAGITDLKLKLTLPPIETLARMCAAQAGYPSPERVDSAIMDEIVSASESVAGTVRPVHVIRSARDVHVEDGCIRSEDLVVESLNWSRLAAELEGDIRLWAFAVTLGSALDELISEQGDDRLLFAYLLDACGAALAQHLAGSVAVQVAERATSLGLATTRYFSPGYCDWEISRGQAQLFRFLEPGRAGITAAPTGLMTPLKSVTTVVLAARNVPRRSPCLRCSSKCDHRREPFDGTGPG